MNTRFLSRALILCAVALGESAAEAQPLGTFTWQLQPFCNVVTVSLTQQGAVYTMDGFDDQCGAPQRALLVGLATPNPDGTIGLGLNIVTAPGGRAVHVDARVTLPSGNGPWTDSAGNSGTFVFGGSGAGSPRPVPPGIPTTIRLLTDGGLLAGGAVNAGAIAATGPGTRMMWYPGKAAFRAGNVTGSFWDDTNIGIDSVAFNSNTRASGVRSAAFGDSTTASGSASTAIGGLTIASGFASLAGGSRSVAGGDYALAFGFSSSAVGDSSVALGTRAVTLAAADGSFVFADGSSTNNFTSFAPNEFVVRAAGGVGFYTNAATTTGVELARNGSSWAPLSDANAKENFRDVAGEDVLAKLAAMSIQEWNYKAQDASIRHMGPTAQEFRAAFGLGDFPLRINTVDADGVALAAVKALEARTRELNDKLTRENDELRARLARLEALLDKR